MEGQALPCIFERADGLQVYHMTEKRHVRQALTTGLVCDTWLGCVHHVLLVHPDV